MSGRELVVLGTASQVPTRHRNHNGYLLRWDGLGVLFDPGEGTQRQMVLAGVAASSIDRICITHFHGDHCLGLPGVLARISLDARPEDDRVVEVYFPAETAEAFDHLDKAAIGYRAATVRGCPASEGLVAERFSEIPSPPLRLTARRLDHAIPTLGWRLEEPSGRTMLPDRLAAAGVQGPDIGRLQREGQLGGVRLEDVSVERPGQSFAFVMDTRICDAAVELAAGVDMLVCESTYLSADEDLAHAHGHMTAAQAARLARDAGARRLVLTHFSQRYPDTAAFAAEAAAAVPDLDVVAAEDLDVIPVPPRSAAHEKADR
jgi:ribonuclease Z